MSHVAAAVPPRHAQPGSAYKTRRALRPLPWLCRPGQE
jgi:hypothetical protein